MNRGITSVLFADDQKIISKTEDVIQEALYIYKQKMLFRRVYIYIYIYVYI